jgi:hypothetical protein
VTGCAGPELRLGRVRGFILIARTTRTDAKMRSKSPRAACGLVVLLVLLTTWPLGAMVGITRALPSVPAASSGQVQGYVTPSSANVFWDGAAISVDSAGYFTVSGSGGTIHNLTGNASGYYNKTVQVTLVANATIWQNLTLRIGNATLSLVVRPTDSAVTLSGRTLALDPQGRLSISLRPGTYSLSVSHALYVTDNRLLNLTPFGILGLVISLQSLANQSGGGGGGGLQAPSPLTGTTEALVVAGVIGLAAAASGALYYDHRRKERARHREDRGGDRWRPGRREERARVRRILRRGGGPESGHTPTDLEP